MLMHGLRAITATASTRGVALLFFVCGFALASWFSRIPAVKEDLGLGDGALGLALLGTPLGSALILPFSGWLVGRLGAGTLALGMGIAMALSGALPGFAGDFWSLFAGLFILGIATGAMDVGMNAKAAELERISGFNMMSAFHGMYGVGVFFGSALGSGFAALHISPAIHLPITALMGALALWRARASLADRPDARPAQGSSPVLALPRGPLWPLALIAGAAFLAEGAAADWSAVYLRDVSGASPAIGALALAGFSIGLTAMRFMGDSLSGRLGDLALLRGGAGLAALGMTLAVLLPKAPIAMLGFITVGLGFAVVVPIAFRHAANSPGIEPGFGVAAVATVAYTGFLAGPPLIGLIAEATGLRAAMTIVPLLALAVALLAGMVAKR